MKVRCVAEHPDPDQIRQLGKHFSLGRTLYSVRIGEEYLVLGLGFWDCVQWVEIETLTEDVVSVPLFLFEVIDGSPSKYWDIRVHRDGALTFWPREFYEPSFHAKLSDDVSSVLELYRNLRQKLQEEHGDFTSRGT